MIWALLLLSAAVLAFAEWMQQDIQLHGEANRDLEARAMAHSGLALALHPLVTKLTPGLEEDLGGGLGYQVKIVSEGGKLNIRWLLEGEDQRKIDMLKKWLEAARRSSSTSAIVFVDCLLDWVDADDAHHLNGTEDDGDYHPPNRPLQSVEEIAQVRGSEAAHPARRAGSEALTIYSQGPLDLSSATPETAPADPRSSAKRRSSASCSSAADAMASMARSTTPNSRTSRRCRRFLGIGKTAVEAARRAHYR